MNVKRERLFHLMNFITRYHDQHVNIKFAYFCMKNARVIEPDVTKMYILRPQLPPKYIEERNEILKAQAEKDPAGNPVWENQAMNLYKFRDAKEVETAVKALDEKYKEELSKFDSSEKRFLEMLEESIDLPLYAFPKEALNDATLKLSPGEVEMFVEMGLLNEADMAACCSGAVTIDNPLRGKLISGGSRTTGDFTPAEPSSTCSCGEGADCSHCTENKDLEEDTKKQE